MRVSPRYAAALAAVCASFTACLMTPSVEAQPVSPPPPPVYGCCTHGSGPILRTPSVNVHAPNVYVGGTNVNVGVNVGAHVNVNVSANASANAYARANAGASTVVYAGGGVISRGGPGNVTTISGLNLVDQQMTVIEESRSRWVESWRVVRAVCLDDTGSPHPASRPDQDEEVGAEYEGEIFRCMSGTAMQVTIGWRVDGEDRYEGGETLMCQKGEALRHRTGGDLYCAPQEARRNCNERSLLRRWGPGVKLVYMRYEEHYTEVVEEHTQRTSQMTLMLDGGVGGYR
ncbi:hypothetical protein [Woodsholea maritima]|uniref:hypothetical protein n=1 Tax=Woodsholea maritima TaxID=240237 RepID=UPI00039D7531|nr:hypothetical protein [Woodsholea maritima]